jgi:arabinogalactan endo-1,4-beta-galactosidase
MPDYVQLGNEVDPGMLWPVGSVQNNTGEQWDAFAHLLKVAALGVQHAAYGGIIPKIIIHRADSGDDLEAEAWYDSLLVRDVPFDIVGFSYYPWWSGTLTDLRTTLFRCLFKTGKPVMIVETAYPFTLDGYPDGGNNFVWESQQLLDEFPATPEGQKAFLDSLVSVVASVPGRMGKAVLWWEPAWIPDEERQSAVENLSTYNYDGDALPAMTSWVSTTLEPGQLTEQPHAPVVRLWPNPFNSTTTITLDVKRSWNVRVDVLNSLGRSVAVLEDGDLGPGVKRFIFDGRSLASGAYFIRVSSAQYGTRYHRITLLR